MADFSSPKATARTMLLAIKRNDVDGIMACFLFDDDAARRDLRALARRDVALHRVVESSLSAWSDNAFGEAGNSERIDRTLLAVSDSVIDRLVAHLDDTTEGTISGDSTRIARITDPAIVRADWLAPLTDIPFYLEFRKIGGKWKLDLTRNIADGKPDDARIATEDLLSPIEHIERVAAAMEQGQFRTVGELKYALTACPGP